MPSRTEKSYSNSRVRRHSGEMVSTKKRSKKEKETDTDSVTTSSSADTLATEPKCPLRFMLGVLETHNGEKLQVRGCPLRRVQLWHTIPLCLLAIINLLIIIVALLGLASYRLVMGTQAVIVKFTKAQFNFESPTESAPDSAKLHLENE